MIGCHAKSSSFRFNCTSTVLVRTSTPLPYGTVVKENFHKNKDLRSNIRNCTYVLQMVLLRNILIHLDEIRTKDSKVMYVRTY